MVKCDRVLLAIGQGPDLGWFGPGNEGLEAARWKLKADAVAPSNVTSPGIVCGTPDFMAPEQGRGDPIDGRSDLYAVGVMLFQLLTERLPFEADSPTQVVMMHLSVPVPDPREVAPHRNIPGALVDVVRKALEKNASRRFQDAMEFSDALQAALEVTVPAGTTELAHPRDVHELRGLRFGRAPGEILLRLWRSPPLAEHAARNAHAAPAATPVGRTRDRPGLARRPARGRV